MKFRTKLLCVMKLTAIFLFAFCLSLSARVNSQQVSYKAKNVSVETVFSKIKEQTGYQFIYNDRDIARAKLVTIDLKNAPLRSALDEILKDQPLTYEIKTTTIVISAKGDPKQTVAPATLTEQPAPPPNIDVTVFVTTTDGQPLYGASIIIKGQNKGIVTDIGGHATLKNIDKDAVVTISFTGFQNQEIKINNRTSIGVRLAISTSELDEIQIGAYSKTSKRLQTGNVSTVKGEDIQKQPVQNVLDAIQGRVSGLVVTQNTGITNGGITVRIQGQNSLQNGSDPLYIIDGVPYINQIVRTDLGGGILGNSGGIANNIQQGVGNPLAFLNPADIASIDILKDAGATAIYGSRGANGVIVITTKKGTVGQTKVDVNLQNGWGHVGKFIDMMNTQQYLLMRNEAFRNDNLTPSASDYDINGVWDTTRYTNWQKTLIGGTAQYQTANINISGGTSDVQYLFGGTYHKETTVFPGNFYDQKASVHFSINSTSANQKFHFQLSSNYQIDNNKLPQTDLTNLAILLEPDAPSLYNSDGTLNWMPDASGTSTWNNPLAAAFGNQYQNKTSNLTSSALIGYRIFPGLEIRSSFGYNNMQSFEYNPSPLSATPPESRASTSRRASYGSRTMSSWVAEPQLSYSKLLGKGKLDIILGGSIQENDNSGGVLTGIGYANDALEGNIQNAVTINKGTQILNQYKYNALFGQLRYNWMDEYIVDFTARRDASSRFGANTSLHNFGAAGAAWIFSHENFIKNALPLLSYGKLKASYGTTGSDQTSDYAYLSLYSAYSPGVPYQNAASYIPNGLSNPYLAWEETKKLSIGADFGFLKDEKIFLSINYAQNRSSNQLVPYNLPLIAGFGSVKSNFPATIQNTTWEFSFNTVNIKTKEFVWKSSLNLTIPQNKLIAFPNISQSSYATSLILGKSINIQPVYHYLGVDPATGLYLVADKNGNPTLYPNSLTDRTQIVDMFPKLYGGLLNSFSFKGFQFDVFFQFVKQEAVNYIFSNTNYPPGIFLAGTSNEPASLLSNRWQKVGDNANFQQFSTGYNYYDQWSNAVLSDAGYKDGSFIRLKNVSISYQVPAKWMKKAHIQNCRLFLQGQNLLTITKYVGLDPESQSLTSLPPLKVYTFGVQIGL